MEGQAVYGSLKEAVDKLVNYSNSLDDPIDTYMRNSGHIGETGDVWGGTAAGKAAPVLAAIKADIVQLQNACREFSEKVDATLASYQQSDIATTNAIDDVKQA